VANHRKVSEDVVLAEKVIVDGDTNERETGEDA
jgi:hypothetical protein